jgi:Na+-translocating ferredoxin:NAD+ oxidoreductase subunit B
MDLAARLDAVLPQTQCTRCGYDGCRPYAEALASGHAELDRCPPGGAPTVRALAALLGRRERPIDPVCGAETPPQVAVIDEARCIGCAKCLPVCPVDAIVGARRYMHTVIAAECSGCELCLPPCPVDCIELVPIADAPLDWAALSARGDQYRGRFAAHAERLIRIAAQRERALAAHRPEESP